MILCQAEQDIVFIESSFLHDQIVLHTIILFSRHAHFRIHNVSSIFQMTNYCP